MRREGEDNDSKHVLVAGPGATATDADLPRASNVLGVTYRSEAEDWLAGFQAGPERVAVVSVGEHSRSAAGPAAGADAGPDVVAAATGAVETVPDVDDVAAVGMLVSDYLAAWDDPGDTVVYVDDLSGLLGDVDAETAFRFVHALLSRASALGARVVVGFDTDEQPPHVARTFGELFDDVRRTG
jgi:hypothetical protein